LKALEVVQLGCRIVTGAYRSVVSIILEAEVGLMPTAICLWLKVFQYAVGLYMLPASHPWWQLKSGIWSTTSKLNSPLRRMLKEFAADIEGAGKIDMERIHPFPRHPTIGNPFENILITTDRGLVVTEAWDSLETPTMYTDGLARNNLTGHLVVWHRTHLLSINLRVLLGTKAFEGG
jgi:hypothetical protein